MKPVGLPVLYICLINNWLTRPNRNTWIYCWLCWDRYQVNLTFRLRTEGEERVTLQHPFQHKGITWSLRVGQLRFNNGLLHLRSIKDYLTSVLQHRDPLWAAASAVQGLYCYGNVTLSLVAGLQCHWPCPFSTKLDCCFARNRITPG